jgi:hypothetical protein
VGEKAVKLTIGSSNAKLSVYTSKQGKPLLTGAVRFFSTTTVLWSKNRGSCNGDIAIVKGVQDSDEIKRLNSGGNNSSRLGWSCGYKVETQISLLNKERKRLNNKINA